MKKALDPIDEAQLNRIGWRIIFVGTYLFIYSRTFSDGPFSSDNIWLNQFESVTSKFESRYELLLMTLVGAGLYYFFRQVMDNLRWQFSLTPIMKVIAATSILAVMYSNDSAMLQERISRAGGVDNYYDSFPSNYFFIANENEDFVLRILVMAGIWGSIFGGISFILELIVARYQAQKHA